MKTLYLLRHAKAEPGGKTVADLDRTLSPRGQEACVSMGEYMKSRDYRPETALVSPAARTRETFARVMASAGWTPASHLRDKLYLATVEEILAEAQSLEDAVASALIVGHNPGMHHIALLLSPESEQGPRPVLELKYPTCSLSVLEFDVGGWGELTPGIGRLADFVTPEEL